MLRWFDPSALMMKETITLEMFEECLVHVKEVLRMVKPANVVFAGEVSSYVGIDDLLSTHFFLTLRCNCFFGSDSGPEDS